MKANDCNCFVFLVNELNDFFLIILYHIHWWMTDINLLISWCTPVKVGVVAGVSLIKRFRSILDRINCLKFDDLAELTQSVRLTSAVKAWAVKDQCTCLYILNLNSRQSVIQRENMIVDIALSFHFIISLLTSPATIISLRLIDDPFPNQGLARIMRHTMKSLWY